MYKLNKSVRNFKGKSMDDYAKARMKDTRKLVILKMMIDSGMNPMMSEVDFVYDGDLNKSLEHFVSIIFIYVRNVKICILDSPIIQCLEVLEDHEDTFLDAFMRDKVPDNVQQLVCTEAAKYCDVEEQVETIEEKDYANDEL